MFNSGSFNSQSKLPIVLTAIYLLISIAAFGVLLAAKEGDSLAGIYVVLVAMPWTPLFTAFTELTGLALFWLNIFLMILGVAINALLIYTFFSWVTRKKNSTG